VRHNFPPQDGPVRLCRTCGASFWRVGDAPCGVARHPDPEVDALYRARRRAARDADESGWRGVDGWASLERVEARLREVDPDGDWRYEGDRYDGHGWVVRRPEEVA
jgi:hypothetical protein